MLSVRNWLGPLLLLLIAGCADGRAANAGSASDEDPLIFAAASLRTALDEAQIACREESRAGFRASYAASSALAWQIEVGAPADLFISADLEWMDYLADRAHIQVGTRVDLLGNRLVLVAQRGLAPALTVGPNFPLAAALGDRRLAMADPAVVPAGKYAKAALTSLSVWDGVADRIAPAENVRAALLLVSRGEAPLGVVYQTDAAADTGVEIVGMFPAETHAPIRYPAALTRGARAAARGVLDCLGGPVARPIFDRWGFGVGAPTTIP